MQIHLGKRALFLQLLLLTSTGQCCLAENASRQSSEPVECPPGRRCRDGNGINRHSAWISIQGKFGDKDFHPRILINHFDVGTIADHQRRLFRVTDGQQEVQAIIDGTPLAPVEFKLRAKAGELQPLVCDEKSVHIESLEERFGNSPVEIENGEIVCPSGRQAGAQENAAWISVRGADTPNGAGYICINHNLMGLIKPNQTRIFQVAAGPQEIDFGDDFSGTNWFIPLSPGETKKFISGFRTSKLFSRHERFYLQELNPDTGSKT
ncbi:MAG TPA: hypothetical protein V6C81_31985 [Planktothrix sp.]|jgi:hypothetical protein